MDERRKRAYRNLLYRALLEIRWMAWTELENLDPLQWRDTAQRIRHAGVIADWLHNLAMFSAIDFRGFNEEWFWNELNSKNRNPTFTLQNYKEEFERELAGE